MAVNTKSSFGCGQDGMRADPLTNQVSLQLRTLGPHGHFTKLQDLQVTEPRQEPKSARWRAEGKVHSSCLQQACIYGALSL